MLTPQFTLPLADELVIDLFAGGGGASTGIEQAICRHPDIAVNHDAEAVSLHQANHPQTLHYVSDVFEVEPRAVTHGRSVGLLWASPDCTFHSKARGGKPFRDRNKARRRRGLAWVVCRWARDVRPRVIALENVEEFRHWGPLLDDGTPCPERRGKTFDRWVAQLRNLGYAVEWRELRACDYGAPTIRKRLFLVARCDGEPIVWPEPTHGPGRKPYRTAAECIDWSLPCPSIFDRARPLAEATMRRIAHGIRRYVLEAAEPYIVRIGHTGHGDGGKTRGIHEPLSTITSKAEHLLVSPTLIQTGYGERPGQTPRVPGLHKPLGTAVDGQKHALVAAFLAKHYGGVVGTPVDQRIGTVTTIDHHSLVAAHLTKFRQASPGVAVDKPAPTVTANGSGKRQGGAAPIGLVTSTLAKLRGTSSSADTAEPLGTISAQGTHHAEVRALLTKFYGQGGQDQDLRDPLHTIPTHDRFALVTVAGEIYAIADIGMRMLQPRELYRAQGFPFESQSRSITVCLASQSSKTTGAKRATTCSVAASLPDPSEPVAVRARIGFGRMDLELLSPARSSVLALAAGASASCPLPMEIAATARRAAVMPLSQESDTQTGRAASPAGVTPSTPRKNGVLRASRSGAATARPAGAATSGTSTDREASRFTTLLGGRASQRSDSTWGTLFSYVAHAIASCIRSETSKACSFVVEVVAEDGYLIERGADGRVLSKAAQVRMCGNSVSPPVARAIVAANYSERQALRRVA